MVAAAIGFHLFVWMGGTQRKIYTKVAMLNLRPGPAGVGLGASPPPQDFHLEFGHEFCMV